MKSWAAASRLPAKHWRGKMTDYEAAFRNLTDKWHESVQHYEDRIEHLEAALRAIIKRAELRNSEYVTDVVCSIARDALKETK